MNNVLHDYLHTLNDKLKHVCLPSHLLPATHKSLVKWL